MSAFIKAISYYLPPAKFTNSDYFNVFPEMAENKNLERVGVKERRIVDPNLTSSDLGVSAAENIFLEHQIDRNKIDFILYCSLESDHPLPATSMLVHKRLMLSKNCGAIDLAVGCSGYPYALSIAKGLIESSGFKNILIINSSTLTKIIHQKDKASRFIFGDGAAATLVSCRDNNWGIGEFIFGSVSKMTDAIIIKDGGARNPIDTSSYINYKDDYGNITNNAHLYMDGPSVFNFGLKAVPQMINDLLTKSKTKLENIDLFIFHQANLYLIESIRKKLFIPEEKVFNFIETVGNTVSATIPIAIYEAQKSGKIKPGSKVLLAGFGVGLSTGATIIHF